ncbi:conserved hypothetical protein [Burkholderia cenocepacia HI2424]|uniref:Uncharacterized protein n=2 Tax=Burkholderia cepacia complex TaxID=87882 RepID=A0A427NSX2_9BURK|nr:conserved hypothetical protein [Burkholderia cenocepacia HI2424]PNO75143.1 hypothetical protein DK10_011135 [Burkholderia cenocepacia]RSC10562.1 hypothetical protein EGT41_19195 [Burkholderia cenocepacia]
MQSTTGFGNLTTTLPAASRRGHPPTAVSPPPLHGSASLARCRWHDRHRAHSAAHHRAALPAGVFACASASRSAARRGDARPSIPRRSSVVHSKL